MDGVVEFDWDDGNRDKCLKHGVSLEEIEAVFNHDPLIGPDQAHSLVEDRYAAIGIEGLVRPVFVIFTMRDVDGVQLVRPISARYMHQEEVDTYA